MGLFFSGAGTRGSVDGCDVRGCMAAGVYVAGRACPVISSTRVRDGLEASAILKRAESYRRTRSTLPCAFPILSRSVTLHLISFLCGDFRQTGVLFSGEGTGGELVGCELRRNDLANLEIIHAANPKIVGCSMKLGRRAGALVCYGGRGEFEDCRLVSNGGPGAEISNSGCPTLRRCRLEDNSGAGARVCAGGRGALLNCVISRNVLPGVEASARGSPPTFSKILIDLPA